MEAIKLHNSQKFQISLLLILMTAFSFMLFIFRYYISDTKVFLFLNWNLFLAIIPFLVSTFISKFQVKSKSALVALIVIWILFFPNSPYILTDLFHLRARNIVPIWYDLIVILSYAWTGLMFGFVSLLQIEKLLSEFLNKNFIRISSVLFLFISSFGVYLGRFLRWNSWDILSDPFGLFKDISYRIIYPSENPRTWGLTILMGILLNLMYFSIKLFRKI